MRKTTACLTAAITLTGCGGVNYALKNYSGVELVHYTYLPEGQDRYTQTADGKTVDNARVYRIFDKPTEHRLMITPSIGGAAGMGAVQGLTFGIVNADAPEDVYEVVAMAYVASTGRTCVETDTKLVIKPQWEVFYECKQSGAS